MTEQPDYYQGPDIIAQNRNWASDTMANLRQILKESADAVNNARANNRPKPNLMSRVLGFLKKIPIVGNVARVISGVEGMAVNALDHSMNLNANWENLPPESKLRANQAIIQANTVLYNHTLGVMKQLAQVMANPNTLQAYNSQQQSVLQNSINHRMQLMREGHYNQQQIANGLHHAIGPANRALV